MSERIGDLLATLRAGLADLSPAEAERALAYYEEYIAEAREAGRSEAEILAKLGQPEEIIALIRAEASLTRAEKRPGPFRLSGAAGTVLGSIASSAAKASLVVGAAIPYTLAMGLYITAVAACLSAPVALGLMLYGIKATMAPGYILEKIGAVGVGIFAGALLAAAGLGLWLAAEAITRLTLRVLRRGLLREGVRDGAEETGMRRQRPGLRLAFLGCAAGALAGLALLLPSGLPLRYFSIWNSMEPPRSAVRTWRYAPGEVGEIRAATLNSRIMVKTSLLRGDAVSVTYEEPDWLRGRASLADGVLRFAEASRGRLPFMNFIARHEGVTVVTIRVPYGYSAKAVRLASRGGGISISLRADSLRAKTDSGAIKLDSSFIIPGAPLGRYDITAASTRGKIVVFGKLFSDAGGVYRRDGATGPKAELQSTDGTIEID